MKPSYEELLELLDDVSAAASNMLLHYHPRHVADYGPRKRLIDKARDICDHHLRQEKEAS